MQRKRNDNRSNDGASPPMERSFDVAPADEEQVADAPASLGYPIVGLGASAGGLSAFQAFFSALPADDDLGIAFVLIQHLSPDHKSILADLVRRFTTLQVFEAEDGMPVSPNCVYIIPPNRNLALVDSTIKLTAPAVARGLRLPIDHLFRSLAAAHRERAIGIVFSGTGSDGALGVRAIKGEGGMAMAQSPDSAEHNGMPLAAIGTGLIDCVMPPAEMPKRLLAYVRHALTRPPRLADGRDGGVTRKVCALLRAQTGHDFSEYKDATLLRRLQRRMALHQIDNPDAYVALARDNPIEVDALFRDLLIGVTSFFRDPDAFRFLERTVIPKLLAETPAHAPIRIWVCACSTGEEAYSIAMLMQEHIESGERPHKLQMFATDIDRAAIEHARLGVYPASAVAELSPDRLARHFTQEPGSDTYRVRKPLRDLLVFSEQDVIQDPPFSRLHLISCRNLLIYLNPGIQKKLITLFHYALLPSGVLFLGPSETLGESATLFEMIERKWKLYRRPAADGASGRALPPSFIPPLFDKAHPARTPAEAQADERSSLRQLTERALLAHYTEVGVLINGRGEVLHIVGRAGLFFEPPVGDATTSILAMAREGLRRELTVALHKAVATKQPVAYNGLRVRSNGDFTPTNLVVRPLPAEAGRPSDLLLVVLEQIPDFVPETAVANAADAGGKRVSELEQALQAKEEYLQTTLEEMETTNEELKSANEELQSVNEELQSTNEELETSKEELQSVNEELTTVNSELQDRVADLSRVNNDMNNLLAGTGVGTVFVDNGLRIARFTPAATQVINLIPTDVGRPIEHVVTNFIAYDGLVRDIRRVLETLAPFEAEVEIKGGAWYLMRMRPYRTTENVIDGAVLTLVDISERKRAEASLRQSEERLNAVLNQAYAGVATTDLGGHYTYVNNELCGMLGYAREELLKMRMQEITHPEDLPRNLVQFEALAGGGTDFESEHRYVRKDGTALWTSTRFNSIRNARDAPQSVVVIAFDISERKRLEAELARTDAQLAKDLDAIGRLHAINTLYVGPSSLPAVLDEVVGTAVDITGADGGTLQLLDASGALTIAAHRGVDAAYIDFWNRSAKKEGSAWRALELRQRIVVPDVAASPLFAPDARDVLRAAGVRALEATPLIGRFEALVGVCTTLYRPRQSEASRSPAGDGAAPDSLPPRMLTLLDLLARQTSDVVERARSERQPERSG